LRNWRAIPTPRPDPEPPADVIVTAQVNVQLGNTPAGQEPACIVTGQVIASQGNVRRRPSWTVS
jgi:hypothetical protein